MVTTDLNALIFSTLPPLRTGMPILPHPRRCSTHQLDHNMKSGAVAYGFDASFISGLSSFGLGFGLRGEVSAAAFAEPSAD